VDAPGSAALKAEALRLGFAGAAIARLDVEDPGAAAGAAHYRAWYAPTVITIGLLGLACTIGAFASVHRRRLPFALLGAASVSLLIGWVVTGL